MDVFTQVIAAPVAGMFSRPCTLRLNTPLRTSFKTPVPKFQVFRLKATPSPNASRTLYMENRVSSIKEDKVCVETTRPLLAGFSG